MNQSKISSLYQSYKLTEEISGDKAPQLKKSYLAYIISYIFQGLAFSLFYPLFSVVLSKNFVVEDTFFWFLLLVLFSLISLCFKWYALNFSYCSDLTDVTHDIRVKLGNKIKIMPLQKLAKYRTGELNSILGSNVDESVLHMGIIAGMAFEALIVPFIIVVTTFFIDIKMALVLLIAFPLALPLYRFTRKKAKLEKKENSIAHSTLEANTVEYLQGLPIMRSLNQVGEKATTLNESIKKVRVVQKNEVLSSTIPMVVMNTLIELMFLLVLSLGAIWIINGSFTIAALISLLIILNRLSEPLSNFLAIASVLDIMEYAFYNIKKILDAKVLSINEPKASPNTFDISFENVNFNYLDNSDKALKNVNLNINANSLTAIVGPSGSGKTTIVRLIMRYDDPSFGEIKIGGVNIKNMEQNQLMKLISVVFQDVYLFDDTILNNIRMGNPNATDEEVIEASKKAYCDEFVSRLPNGYETKVGEIGGSLSGGERQRISIARAILKNSPIVILDEPTSSLDTQSEVVVQKALDELISNKTVIVIAHRLSTISHASNIIVVEDGEIIESGKHENLILNKGKYYSMFEAQQRIKEWNKKENE